MEDLLGDPLAQFPQLPDGGNWADDDQHLLDDDWWDTDQLAADSSGVNHVQEDADPSRRAIPAAGTHHLGCDAPLEQSPAAAAAAYADATAQVAFDPPEPAIMLSTEPDHEMMEVAEMVRVAAQCGEDDAARTAWSQEEHKELLDRLHLYAEDDAVTRCFKIAFHLPNKTALDVALRCRWLQDKKRKTAGRSSTALGKLTKVKGTKIAKISNKIYPLSKEALNTKSNKELIQDNNKFLKRIEENLKTGQLANTKDYFYYVKTNMDAIVERGSEFGISMAMPPIDEQGLEEILQARLNSLDLTEDA